MVDCVYLAMTAAEMQGLESLPENFAYMACHFSSYGTGLSNLPDRLPKNSILILNDRTPICNHNSNRILEQLGDLVDAFGCSGILLDFQRREETQTHSLCKTLVGALPCPVGVSHLYATDLACPVFVPPLPLGQSLSRHLAEWKDREIWLDIALGSILYTITQECNTHISCPPPHDDLTLCQPLHCTYQFHTYPDRAEISVHRFKEHLSDLVKEAHNLGVSKCIGLYQELK